MYDYFNEKGEDKVVPKSINVGVPFSLRKPVKEIKNVKMDNDFASLALSIEQHAVTTDAYEKASRNPKNKEKLTHK